MNYTQPKNIILILIISIQFNIAQAQDADSLYSLARNNNSTELTQECIDLAKKNNDTELLSKSLELQAYQYSAKMMYYNSVNSYFEAINLYRDQGDVTRQVVVLISVGIIYTKAGFIDKALDFYEEALALNDPEQNGLIYYHIGKAYRLVSNYPAAQKYFDLSKQEDSNNTSIMNEIEAEKWFIAKEQGDYDLAFQYTSLDDSGSDYDKIRRYNNLGVTLLEIGKTDSAYQLFNEGLSLAKKTGSKQRDYGYWVSKLYSNLGKIKGERSMPLEAISDYENAFSNLKRKEFHIEYVFLAKKLSDHYKGSDNKRDFYIDEVFAFAEELAILKEQMKQLSIRYQVEAADYKHQMQIQYEAGLRQRNIYVSVLSLIGLIALGLTFQVRRNVLFRRKRREEARALLKEVGYLDRTPEEIEEEKKAREELHRLLEQDRANRNTDE